MKTHKHFLIIVVFLLPLVGLVSCKNQDAEIEQLRQQLASLQKQLTEEEDAKVSAQSKVTDLENQVKDLNQQVENVENQLKDLENSQNEVSSLPHIYINTDGKTIIDEPKISATLEIKKNQEVIEQHHIGIELRGATSQQLFEKKSYGLETWDQEGDDLNVELGGYPEEEDWILHGPYSDKTLIRNVLIYQLSNAIGRYATRTSFYELTINGDYEGTYVLMEKIKRDKNRVDIKKVDSDDITGGYILKIDKNAGKDRAFSIDDLGWESKYDPFGKEKTEESSKTIRFLYEYPDAEDIEEEEKEYIQNYIKEFENALASQDYRDPSLGYRKYIDVDSFVDFFLLNEISKNVDAYRLSTFFYKNNKNGKLFMGPIWDFNISFGNANYCEGERHIGWSYKFNSRCSNHFQLVPFWWSRLLSDPYFKGKIKERWSELRTDQFSTESILNRVNTLRVTLEENGLFQRNFKRWAILGEYIWPNNYVGMSVDDEYRYLRDWIQGRLNWLDNAVSRL